MTPPPHDAPTGIGSDAATDHFTSLPADPGETRLASGPETRLASGPETRLASGPDASDPETRLASGPDASDPETRLASGPEPTSVSAAEDPAETRLAPPTAASRAHGSPSETADHGPLAVGQSFGSRYHIIRLLGIGGMGAVYQAWDAELAVTVALKVIRPEVMADPKTAAEIERRFKRELLLARQVTHKNVVRIHDLGDIGGIKYITMSFVEGADLASVVKEKGKLPPDRALKIARSVVAGLVEAHKAGVVHRDLKPANIMIDDNDEALIMDFGIARSSGRPTAGPMPGNTTIVGNLKLAANAPADATMLGAVIGTVEYMAPEQARGQHIDQRADIYALGLIIYDILVGQPRAQRAGSAIAELQARMEKPPPTVKSLVPEIPAALDQFVSRCLEPDPAKRFQTTQDVAEALTWLNDKGERIRVRRVVGMRLFAAAILLGLFMLGGTWWFARGPAVPVQHDPVSVLIADFQNQTNDPTFDGTLEPIVKLALEGAGFISALDRVGIRRSLDVRPPDVLDERAAQDIAVKNGVGVILAGSIGRQGSGYPISMKVTQVVTGNVITTVSNRASSKDQVLSVATRLADSVRESLGGDTSDDAQRFAMDTLAATSVDAVREYAAGMIANSNSKFEEARQHFSKAVERDAKFGMGWTALAMMSFNLDKKEDTVKYVNTAMQNLDTMTPRERFRTRGLFYLATNDYKKCIEEYGELVEKYAADVSARNNVALCSSRLGQNAEAAKQMQEVVKILPNRALYRENLALYSSYAGKFDEAEREARLLKEPGVFGLIALAFAQIGQGQLAAATETYRAMGRIDAQGASYMASGLADLAIYEGRYSDAANILETAAKTDVTEKDTDRAAAKYVALAYARLMRGENRAAIVAAEQALHNSRIDKIQYLAGRIFIEAGEAAKIKPVVRALSAPSQPAGPQAYAKLLEGTAALKAGDSRQAIKSLDEANTLFDSWMGRFELGRAYLTTGAFTQADSEFDKCIQRRGEVLSLFLDEEPTYGYLPPVYYYQGKAREGLKTSAFADSYRTYIDIRGQSLEDKLLPEARKYTNK